MSRQISEIAIDILRDWKKPYFGAVPYLHAMMSLSTVEQDYGMDSADSIIRYFLCNASTYRGEKAKALKKELKQLVGIK